MCKNIANHKEKSSKYVFDFSNHVQRREEYKYKNFIERGFARSEAMSWSETGKNLTKKERQSLLEHLNKQYRGYNITLEDGTGSIMLEDYHDYATGQPALLMTEEFSGAYTIATQSPYAQNLDLNTEAGFDTASVADDILDFTERNPFGEVDE